MLIHDITAFYNDDFNDLRTEFKEEFNRIIEEEGSEGLYPFFFCYYKNYQLHTEICYCIVTPKTALFLWSPSRLTLYVDDALQVTSGDITADSIVFTMMFDDKNDDLHFIGNICNSFGCMYDVHTLKYEKPKSVAIDMLEYDRIPVESLLVDEDEMTQIAFDYLEKKIEYFKTKIDEAVDMDSPYVGIDENPYANEYYDREYHMRDQAIRLGDKDV